MNSKRHPTRSLFAVLGALAAVHARHAPVPDELEQNDAR